MTDYTTKLKEGDRLRFEKVTVEARKITEPVVFQRSKTHKGMRVVCSKTGIIYVDKAWKIKKKK